jgi:hypothetical protein
VSDYPAPNPSGYQPAPGEGFTQIAVEVRPSFGYQTAGLTGTYVFPTPRSFSEALPAIDDVREALRELAVAEVNALVAERDVFESGGPAPAPAPQAQVVQHPAAAQAPVQQAAPAAAQAADRGLTWQHGTNPNGETFAYLPDHVATFDKVKPIILRQLAELGVPADAPVTVFDDRKDIAQGTPKYQPFAVKVKTDAGYRFIGGAEFNNDGSVKTKVSGKGREELAKLNAPAPAGGGSSLPF